MTARLLSDFPQDHAENAQDEFAAAFLAACKKCDANAIATFAPPTVDWEKRLNRPLAHDALSPMRVQTVSEVLVDSLKFGKDNGPDMSQAMQLVLNLAYSAMPQAVMAQQARDLLREMVTTAAVFLVEAE